MSELKYKIVQNYYHPRRYGQMLVYQIGRTHCGSGTVIAEHPQRNYIEFTVATGGKATNTTDGIAVPLVKGDIYVSFPGDFHAIISDVDDPLKYDFLTVYTEDTELLRGLDEVMERYHDADARVIRSEHIASLVSDAISEMNSEGEYTEKVMEAIIGQILVYTVRELKSQGHTERLDGVSDADIICFRIMKYIDKHIYTMKSLRELCSVTNYNYNYLSNLFKKTTGSTLREYYRNRRLEAALLMIGSGENTVTEAAELLGYSSVYSFSTAFKNKYGTSPTSAKKK